MALETKFVFLLVLSLFYVHVASQNAYDYFWLVQQWPPAVCFGRRCTQPNLRMFTIHGLWPQNFTFPSPANCPGPAYDSTQMVGALKTNLDRYWPDVINGRNNAFWSREWTKHGTCSSGVYNQVGYFTTSVQKRTQFDLQNALAVAGITPTNRIWTLVNIRNAIQTRTTKRPAIRCDASSRSNLTEIVFCYNKAGTAMIDCPSGDRCNANVRW